MSDDSLDAMKEAAVTRIFQKFPELESTNDDRDDEVERRWFGVESDHAEDVP